MCKSVLSLGISSHVVERTVCSVRSVLFLFLRVKIQIALANIIYAYMNALYYSPFNPGVTDTAAISATCVL